MSLFSRWAVSSDGNPSRLLASGSVAALVKHAVGPKVCLCSPWSPNCHQDCSLQDARVLGNVSEKGILSWLQTDTKLRPSRLQDVKLDINQEKSTAGIGVQGAEQLAEGIRGRQPPSSKSQITKSRWGVGKNAVSPNPTQIPRAGCTLPTFTSELCCYPCVGRSIGVKLLQLVCVPFAVCGALLLPTLLASAM